MKFLTGIQAPGHFTILLMRKIRLKFSYPVVVSFALLAQSCASVSGPEASQFKNASWDSHKVASGVVWKYHRFDSLFDGRQSITVFDIDLDRVRVRVDHLDSGFFRVSDRAQEAGAVVAVNGSFFDTRRGGSVVFFQKDGMVPDSLKNDLRSNRDNAGFAIDHSGKVSIIQRPARGWSILDDFSTVLSSGPLLVYDAEAIPQTKDKFNTNRHPRTAVGLTKKHHLVAVVVDGRSPQAYGMTTEELAAVMRILGCAHAMNLDGGGSSTAWVSGQPYEGVVNYPSDNKKFDHEGARAVSNCILFLIK